MVPTPVPTPTILPTPSPEVVAGIGALFLGVFGVFVLGCGFWIIALVDILKSEFKDSSNKLIWILVTLLLPFLGPILYFLVGRKQIKKGTGINLKVALTVLSFFIWYPIGVVLMWVWTNWPRWFKILITVILGSFFVLGWWGKYLIK